MPCPPDLPERESPARGTLAHEHGVVLGHLARVQARCSELIARQAARLERQSRELMRLRGEIIRRDTELAWAREDHTAWLAAQTDLPRRQALARQVQELAQRLHALTRARQREELRTAPPGGPRAVLCLGLEEPVAAAARRLVERHGDRWVPHDAAPASASPPEAPPDDLEAADPARLEHCLKEADLVICRTGCLSHQAHWRVQDHCRRTGKRCVLVQAPPRPMQWLREVDAVLRVSDLPDAITRTK